MWERCADPKVREQATAMTANFCATVTIVMVNKALFTGASFPVTLLGAIHFAVGSAFLASLKAAGKFSIPEGRRMTRSLWLLVLVQSSSVVYSNLSLRHNSIGFYQLAKKMQMPIVAVIDWAVFKKSIPLVRVLALLGVLLGVVAATSTDMSFNVTGTIFAVMSVLCASVEAITWARVQQVDGWETFQAMYMVMPWCSAVAFIESIVLEQDITSWAFNMTPSSLALLVASCTCAFAVNYSMVWFNGAASALTYALLGYGKTCAIIAGGAIIFDSAPSLRSLIGAVFAMTMLGVYTAIRFKEQEDEKAERAAAAAAAAAAAEGEGDKLVGRESMNAV